MLKVGLASAIMDLKTSDRVAATNASQCSAQKVTASFIGSGMRLAACPWSRMACFQHGLNELFKCSVHTDGLLRCTRDTPHGWSAD